MRLEISFEWVHRRRSFEFRWERVPPSRSNGAERSIPICHWPSHRNIQQYACRTKTRPGAAVLSATMNWSLILHGRKGREAQTTPEIIVHGKLWRQTLVQQAETNLTSPTEAAAYMQCMFPFAAHTRLHTRDAFRRQYDMIYACGTCRPQQARVNNPFDQLCTTLRHPRVTTL